MFFPSYFSTPAGCYFFISFSKNLDLCNPKRKRSKFKLSVTSLYITKAFSTETIWVFIIVDRGGTRTKAYANKKQIQRETPNNGAKSAYLTRLRTFIFKYPLHDTQFLLNRKKHHKSKGKTNVKYLAFWRFPANQHQCAHWRILQILRPLTSSCRNMWREQLLVPAAGALLLSALSVTPGQTLGESQIKTQLHFLNKVIWDIF